MWRFFLLAVLCAIPQAGAATVSPWGGFSEKLEREFSAKEGGALGYAIVQGPHVLSGVKGASEKTPFEMGELLQPLTTLAVCALGEKAEIWDRPVRLHLQNGQSCALRHLFGMTAGVSATADGVLARVDNAKPADVFDLLRQTSLSDVPGRVRAESRLSFLAGAYLLTNNPRGDEAPELFARLIKEHVFEPLAISGTVVLTPQKTRLAMTADGAARWLFAEASGGRFPGEKPWLSAEEVRMRYLPVTAADNRQLGLGWQRDYYEGMEMVSRLWVSPQGCALIGVFPRYRAGLVLMVAEPTVETPLFMQNAFLDMADLLREQPLP